MMRLLYTIFLFFLVTVLNATILKSVNQLVTSEKQSYGYTVPIDGDFQLGDAWIEVIQGDSIPVEIFTNENRVEAFYAIQGQPNRFGARLEKLFVNDEIIVKVSPKASSFRLSFSIAAVSPFFEGLPVYSVADYGAVGDGVTDDKAAIVSAVNAAADGGGGIVKFDGSKTYRVIGLDDLTEEYLFELYDKSNVKIDGNGAKLLLHPPDRLAYFEGTENVQLDGFVIDYDPLPYYQGAIDSIDINNLTVDITVPERYKVPEVGNTSTRSKYFGKIFIPESDGSRLGPGPHLYVDATTRINGEERKIRVQGRSDMTSALQTAIDDGATELVVPDFKYGQRGQWCASIVRSSCVTFSNLRFNMMLRQGLMPRQNYGPITFSNIDILTPHPETELFVSWRGHWLAGDNRFGFLIEDGEYDAGCMYDDLFNFYSKMMTIESLSGNTIYLDTHNEEIEHWESGDWVSVWSSPDQAVYKGMAMLTSLNASSDMLVLEFAIDGAAVGDILVNENLMNRGTLVRNCSTNAIGAKRASCRIRTPSVFEDCHFENIYFWVYSSTMAEGGEGPRPRDVYFDNVYFQGGSSNTQEIDVARSPISVYFKNSTFDGVSLDIQGCEKVVLDSLTFVNMKGNVFKLTSGSEAWLPDGTLRNGTCENITQWVPVDASSVLHTTRPSDYPPVVPPLSQSAGIETGKRIVGESVMIVPNPAKSRVNISHKGFNNAHICVCDLQGRIMFKDSFTSNKDVNVTEFKMGLYIIELSDNIKVETSVLLII